MEEKLKKSKCLREDIKRLVEEQKAWKIEQERIAVEENKKIAEYIAAQDERTNEMKEIERQKLMAKLEQQEKMCSALVEIEVSGDYS